MRTIRIPPGLADAVNEDNYPARFEWLAALPAVVNEIASENNSTTFFPIPIELLRGFTDMVTKRALPSQASGEPVPSLPMKDRVKT